MSYDIVSGDDLDIGEDFDVSGDDDVSLISGDEVDLILGARRRRARGGGRGRSGRGGLAARRGAGLQRRAFQQAAAARYAGSGVMLRESQPTRSGRIVLGMNSSGTVAAAASTNITARPQSTAFKPERIVIPSSIAPDFTIQDIKCGNVSQLAQSGDLAAEAFVQTVFGGEMDMATVQTSQDFVMAVTNISGAARTFRAVVYGHAVY